MPNCTTETARVLLLEAPDGTVRINFGTPRDLFEVRDLCRLLVRGVAPRTIRLVGTIAFASY
jgi:hypothetical protein